MFRIRRGEERGHFDHGWLNTYHTFSFGNYYDPGQMGFNRLRVINEDYVRPGNGFGRHGHRDMEILTYVLEGTLEHQDSLGHTEQLRAGEMQRMTAGSGIQHSEYNPSSNEPVHLYQIWIEPRERGLKPEYEQRRFERDQRLGKWQLVASPEGRDESMAIHQDVDVLLADVRAQDSLAYSISGRDGWLQVIRGTIEIGKQPLQAGDAAALSGEQQLDLNALTDSEVMLFDFASQ